VKPSMTWDSCRKSIKPCLSLAFPQRTFSYRHFIVVCCHAPEDLAAKTIVCRRCLSMPLQLYSIDLQSRAFSIQPCVLSINFSFLRSFFFCCHCLPRSIIRLSKPTVDTFTDLFVAYPRVASDAQRGY